MTCRAALLGGVLGVSCLAACAAARAAEGDKAAEAAAAFESLYGADLKRVRATRDPKDDLDLAVRLVAAAKDAAAQPEFLAILCTTACDLASAHPDGHKTAEAALDLLASQVPVQAGPCAERLAEIHQKQFDAARGAERSRAGEDLIDALRALADAKESDGAYADAAAVCRRAQAVAKAVKSDRAAALDARLANLAQAMKSAKTLEDLKKQLDATPQDAALREKLVRLLLTELDDPAEAAKYIEGVADESLRKYVPAAARGTASAPELACLELAEWYRGLGETAPTAKAAMLTRAKAYYERFLAFHAAQDMARTKATLALKKAEEDLKRLGGPPRKRGRSAGDEWIDILPLIDPAKDAVAGKWERRGAAVALLDAVAGNRIMIPVIVAGNYELEVRFIRTSGTDAVAILFPVGPITISAPMSAEGGGYAGLEKIDGRGVRDNALVRPFAFENGRLYRANVKVVVTGDRADVQVAVEGKPPILWSGLIAALTTGDGWRLPLPQCPGMGTWRTTVTLEGLRLRMLSGGARPVRPNDPAAKAAFAFGETRGRPPAPSISPP